MKYRNYKRTPSRAERGQVIILIALAVVGLIAILGLMMDGGILLLEYDRLKRSVDAGAIAASLQFREGYTIQELTKAATQLLTLNQVAIDQTTLVVETCDSLKAEASPDPALMAQLCTDPPRKLVYVKATENVQFSFMKVIGINSAPITTDSIGEAASVDLVLVLDASQSMAAEGGNYPTNMYDPAHFGDVDADGHLIYGTPSRNDVPADDPSQCNPTDTCHPFKEVKDAAIALVNRLYFPYDHVAVVTFDKVPHLWQTLSDTNGKTAAQAEQMTVDTISGLTVYQPPECDDPLNPAQTHCLVYDSTDGTFVGFEYPMWRATVTAGNPIGDPSSRPTSNIGGGLALAGEEFGAARENSLWVVVALAGGPANTGCTHTTDSFVTDCDGKNIAAQGRICPDTDWDTTTGNPLCRDPLSQSRHPDTSPAYDGDDYARDMADWLSSPNDVGATVFTIGLGDLVVNNPAADTDAGAATKDCASENYYNQPGAAGERLLCYVAEKAGGLSANHGTYTYAPDADGLTKIFIDIASNIAIRLSQ